MTRWLLVGLSGCVLSWSACADSQPDPETVNPLGVEMSELADLCVLYNTCVADYNKVGICISDMTNMVLGTRWEFGLYTSLEPGLAAALVHRDCVLDSQGDCDRVLACLGGGEIIPGCDGESYCDGETLHTCMGIADFDYGTELVLDCSAVGLECAGWGPRNFCAERSGYQGSDYRVSCKGGFALVEHAGVRSGMNCEWLGSRCNPGTYSEGAPLSYCIGTGAACEQGESQGCDGDHFVTCVGGKLARTDCTLRGDTCGTNPDGNQSCIHPGDCDPYWPPEETCEAGMVGFCGAEGWEEVSCAGLGYSGCEAGEGARCVP